MGHNHSDDVFRHTDCPACHAAYSELGDPMLRADMPPPGSGEVTTEHDPYDLHRHDEQGRELVRECDEQECKALQEPQTIEEYQAALEHWEHHGYLHGCSHGN